MGEKIVWSDFEAITRERYLELIREQYPSLVEECSKEVELFEAVIISDYEEGYGFMVRAFVPTLPWADVLVRALNSTEVSWTMPDHEAV